MPLFAIISSPFTNPWLAIIHGIVQHCFAFFPSAGHSLFATSLVVNSCSLGQHLLKNVKSTSAIVCWYGWVFFFSLKIPLRKDGILPIQTEHACFCQPMSWSMAAMLRDSTAVVAVVRTRPRAIPLAMIHMRKSIHGFPFVPLYGYGAPLGGLRPPELRYKHKPTYADAVWCW